jgi:hypothetical protein
VFSPPKILLLVSYSPVELTSSSDLHCKVKEIVKINWQTLVLQHRRLGLEDKTKKRPLGLTYSSETVYQRIILLS